MALSAGLAWPGPPQPPKEPSLAGKLLVASRSMGDPRFARTVVYLVMHDRTGAMGLVVNRSFRDVPVASLLEAMGQDPAGVRGSLRMHYGGPVAPGSVLVLHTADWRSDETKVVEGGYALTSTPDILRAIGTGAGPYRALLALSYSGWGAGQLEREIQDGAWVIASSDAALVFGDADDTKWERAMARQESRL
jgi:putative transcriptional regulator